MGKLSILWEMKERSIQLFKMLQKNQPVQNTSNSKDDETSSGDKIAFYIQKLEDIVFTQCVPKVINSNLYQISFVAMQTVDC